MIDALVHSIHSHSFIALITLTPLDGYPRVLRVLVAVACASKLRNTKYLMTSLN